MSEKDTDQQKQDQQKEKDQQKERTYRSDFVEPGKAAKIIDRDETYVHP